MGTTPYLLFQCPFRCHVGKLLLRQLVIVKDGLVQSLEASGLEEGCATLGVPDAGSQAGAKRTA